MINRLAQSPAPAGDTIDGVIEAFDPPDDFAFGGPFGEGLRQDHFINPMGKMPCLSRPEKDSPMLDECGDTGLLSDGRGWRDRSGQTHSFVDVETPPFGMVVAAASIPDPVRLVEGKEEADGVNSVPALGEVRRAHTSAPSKARRKSISGKGAVTDTKGFARGYEQPLLDALGVDRPGRSGKITCPMGTHPDRDPSWRFDIKAGRYFCTCGNGSIVDVVQAIERLDDPIEACNWIRQQLGIELIGATAPASPQEKAAQAALAQKRLAEAAERSEQAQIKKAAEDAEANAKALSMWGDSLPATPGSDAEAFIQRYLASRGITGRAGANFRFLPAWGMKPPRMVCAFGFSKDAIGGVHVTHLLADGSGNAKDEDGKSIKLTYGRGHTLPLVAAYVEGCDTLMVAEGVEDALSAHQALGVTAWASSNGGRLPGIAEHIPDHVKFVTIAQDDDKAGREGTARLAAILASRGIAVRIFEAEGSNDLNSILQKEGDEGVRAHIGAAQDYQPAEAVLSEPDDDAEQDDEAEEASSNPWDAYRALRAEALIADEPDVQALLAALAACRPNAIEKDVELRSLVGLRNLGIRALSAQYRTEDSYVRSAAKTARMEASRAEADSFTGQPGDLTISHHLPFEINLRRFHERYVMLQQGGNNTMFADLTRLGQTYDILEWGKVEIEYAPIYEITDEEKALSLLDAYKFSKSNMRRTANHKEFDPRQAFGFRQETASVGVLNTYRAPVHAWTGGSTAAYHTFLAHLVPNETERGYVYSWLACKVQRPHIVGHTLIMVADSKGRQVQGTGRGTFVNIIEKLFRPEYVAKKTMDDISGKSGNGWSDWMLGKLFVSIPEILESTDANSYRDRKQLYNTLKNIFDPNEIRKGIQQRKTTAYDADVFMTGIGATNHADALVIPEEDRRFAMVSNGAPMTTAMRDSIQVWLNDPLNIGALYREFQAFAWQEYYDPHGVPPMTDAKRRMAELSSSSADQSVSELIEFFDSHNISIVSEQLVGRWCQFNDGLENNEKAVRVASRSLMHNLPTDRNRVRVGGYRFRVQAYRDVKEWSQASADEIAAAYQHANRCVDEMALVDPKPISLVRSK